MRGNEPVGGFCTPVTLMNTKGLDQTAPWTLADEVPSGPKTGHEWPRRETLDAGVAKIKRLLNQSRALEAPETWPIPTGGF